MENQMLDALGTCLKANDIEFVTWTFKKENYITIPIVINDNNVVDYIEVVFHEFVYKVSHYEQGIILKSSNTVDTCEFIKKKIKKLKR